MQANNSVAFLRRRRQTPTGSCASRCASCWATWTASTRPPTRFYMTSYQPQTGQQDGIQLEACHSVQYCITEPCSALATRWCTTCRMQQSFLLLFSNVSMQLRTVTSTSMSVRSRFLLQRTRDAITQSAAAFLLPAGTCSAGQRLSQKSCEQPTRTTSLPASTRQVLAHVMWWAVCVAANVKTQEAGCLHTCGNTQCACCCRRCSALR